MDLPQVTLSLNGAEEFFITQVLNLAELAKNAAQAKDMVKRGVVKVDHEVVDASYSLKSGDDVLIQAGKKAFAQVLLVD